MMPAKRLGQIVVPAKAGTQNVLRRCRRSLKRTRAGFWLALRLAGMTMKPGPPDPLTTPAVLQPNCQIAYLALALQLDNSGFVRIQGTHA